MKITSIFRVIMMPFLAMIVLPNAFANDSVVRTFPLFEQVTGLHDDGAKQQDLVARATAETKVVVDQATKNMDRAREMLFSDTTPEKKVVKIVKAIIEQNFIAVQAQQKLKRLYERIAKENESSDHQKSYVSTIVCGVKDFGQDLFTSLSYTKNEKRIAKHIIVGLKQQKEKIIDEYDSLPLYGSRKRAQLEKRYEIVIEQIKAEIHTQQCITGDKMSLTKQGVLLTSAAATVIAGIMLTNKFLMPELFAVKTEDATSLDNYDASKSVEQPSDSSDIMQQEIVEPVLNYQEEQQQEVLEDNQLDTIDLHEDQQLVDQVKEEIVATIFEQQEQEQQDVELVVPCEVVEKGRFDNVWDYIGWGNSSEETVTPEEPVQMVQEKTIELVTSHKSVDVNEQQEQQQDNGQDALQQEQALECDTTKIEQLVELEEALAVVQNPVEIKEEELIIETPQDIEISEEKFDNFSSTIDSDGNPVLVALSRTKQGVQEVVAVPNETVTPMTLHEDYVAEQEKLDALKYDYGWGYFGTVTLAELEKQENKVANIREQVVAEDTAWNHVFSHQQDLQDNNIFQKTRCYQDELCRRETEQQEAQEKYDAARDNLLNKSKGPLLTSPNLVFKAARILGLVNLDDEMNAVKNAETELQRKKALLHLHKTTQS